MFLPILNLASRYIDNQLAELEGITGSLESLLCHARIMA